MIDCRLERGYVHSCTPRNETLPQHASLVVVPHERELRKPIDFHERLTEGAERGLHIGGNGERVGKGRERARRHR